jgi:hypothetical protein
MIAWIAGVMVSAGAGSGAYGTLYAGNGPLATRAPYPGNTVDDVHRPGFNGRLWVGRPILGGTHGPYPSTWPSPGPEAYGALDNEDARLYTTVGHLTIPLSPWIELPGSGLQRLDEARSWWLKEQGYVGGVRTFVNDAYLPPCADGACGAGANAGNKGEIKPSATIRLPDDMPRVRGRMRVNAQPQDLPGEGPARISWPLNAPREAVERTAARGGLIGPAPATRVATRAE